MNETYTDGFFYHPDAAVAQRVADGELNPRLDDLFVTALEETVSAKAAAEKRVTRLKNRLSEIEDEIAKADAEVARINERHKHQYEAMAKYERGDELDAQEQGLLTPKFSSLVNEQRRADIESQFEEHEGAFEKLEADDWSIERKRVEDGFLYVTVKRAVEVVVAPDTKVAKRVAKAIAKFFSPDFDRAERVHMWDRRASLRPLNPGAG
ncbi:hypothetical protein [Paracoccus tegillarcae]|uniref:Uncharacterized protein n=1 Tax=Paracoccus tegillarcae TaxID=1529068 RepID=A0A2K9EI60_9RHOB|nr:hypothetical protein [Paracoccus tegillarcae]AUH34678.1 hypothetical protein CUV01_15955 [Paracoccus tegillarcae]